MRAIHASHCGISMLSTVIAKFSLTVGKGKGKGNSYGPSVMLAVQNPFTTSTLER